ncbi:MAG: hypothetical protein NDJ18_10750, partial [candidate division Zixibacteria bacterium]|nr:hypothetical protein [candidate division Zixibacteria bacterium]
SGTSQVETHRTKGILLSEKGDRRAALDEFQKAFVVSPNSLEENYNLALIFYDLQVFDSSLYYGRRGLPLSSGTERCYLWSGIVRTLIAMGQKTAAVAELQNYRRECPSATDLSQLEAAIKRAGT